MSASNEWWMWHLTPNGWVAGSEKLDHHREPQHVDPPDDRVLSVAVHDLWPSTFRRLHWEDELFRVDDDRVVAELLEKYGPHA